MPLVLFGVWILFMLWGNKAGRITMSIFLGLVSAVYYLYPFVTEGKGWWDIVGLSETRGYLITLAYWASIIFGLFYSRVSRLTMGIVIFCCAGLVALILFNEELYRLCFENLESIFSYGLLAAVIIMIMALLGNLFFPFFWYIYFLRGELKKFLLTSFALLVCDIPLALIAVQLLKAQHGQETFSCAFLLDMIVIALAFHNLLGGMTGVLYRIFLLRKESIVIKFREY